MLEPSPILLLIYIVIPAVLSALALYVVIRLGVKHGMRAYYSELGHRPSD